MRYKQLSSLAVIELGKGTLLKEHRSSSLLGFDPGIRNSMFKVAFVTTQIRSFFTLSKFRFVLSPQNTLSSKL